jgi:hypothetical protein
MMKEQGVLRVVFTWALHICFDLHDLLDAGKGLDQAQLGDLAGLVDALRNDVGTAKITATPLMYPRVRRPTWAHRIAGLNLRGRKARAPS